MMSHLHPVVVNPGGIGKSGIGIMEVVTDITMIGMEQRAGLVPTLREVEPTHIGPRNG